MHLTAGGHNEVGKEHPERPAGPPALVVSAGLQGLAVTRALGRRGVRVVVLHSEESDFAAHSRHASECVRIPRPDFDGRGFVDRLLSLSERFRGGVVIPTSDEAVKDVARRKGELAPHYVVACPDWPVAERFIDKRYTYEVAEELGIPIPQTIVPAGREELPVCGEQVGYPCLIKPRESHLYADHFDGKKLELATGLPELRRAYDAAADAGLDIVVQELIPGPDSNGVNYNAYRTAAGVTGEFTARKLRLRPPGSGRPCAVLSTELPGLRRPGGELLDALDLEGFACTEFKRDPRSGAYKLLEVNGRHNHSSWLAVRCGVDFPWMNYLDVTGAAPPPAQVARTGVYWIDEWADIISAAGRLTREDMSLRRLARPWVREHVFAVFDRDDPAPFVSALRRIVGRRLPLSHPPGARPGPSRPAPPAG